MGQVWAAIHMHGPAAAGESARCNHNTVLACFESLGVLQGAEACWIIIHTACNKTQSLDNKP